MTIRPSYTGVNSRKTNSLIRFDWYILQREKNLPLQEGRFIKPAPGDISPTRRYAG